MKSKSFRNIDDVLAYYGWGGEKKGENTHEQKGNVEGACEDRQESGQSCSGESLLEEPRKGA